MYYSCFIDEDIQGDWLTCSIIIYMWQTRIVTWVRLTSRSQFSSTQSLSLTLCDPMDCSMPDFPVHHQRPALSQTHFLRVGDAIQPSHPLSSPSPAFSLPQQVCNTMLLTIIQLKMVKETEMIFFQRRNRNS